ncbi:CU044_2847 family protein [Massilia niastensis]|uniref:CU044_2847 family protein n=1 Tax=Massilia niastensis TaxID=544911 RepID=UPI0012EB1692|nr:CU044_2847 family protein [Massilia niastensis]
MSPHTDQGAKKAQEPKAPELEISVSQSGGLSAAEGGITERAKDAFTSLGDLLSDAIAPLRAKLSDTAASADEVEIRLDLAMKAGGKWVVMSMEGAATVSIKLVWKKK